MNPRAWILFYYNSLPDMPDGCRLFSPKVMHRDFFECNPTNTGHHAYPKFESMSYDEDCHGDQVRKIVREQSKERYVVFYTRHTHLDRTRGNKLVGYFKVGHKTTDPLGFIASEAVLLPKNKCVPISYNGRGVPVSEGRSAVKQEVDAFLEWCIKNKRLDVSRSYRKETAAVIDKLNSAAGRKRILSACASCDHAHNCFWGRRQNKAEVLGWFYGKRISC
jgi:hypothetical protein